jgi:hypothetical protein
MPQAIDPPAAVDPPASVDPSPIEIPDVPAPAFVSTLGQTPHEPKVRPWELELLISGALVFGMIQLPERVDAWYDHVSPALDGGFAEAAFFVAIYAKMALYAVICGFVLHLAIRAYWVGVIGLEAVFPGGIVWEKTRAGPIMREIQRKATPPLQSLIDGADRLASLVFAGGLTLALLFGFSLLVLGAGSLLAYGTVGLALGPVASAATLEVVVVLLVVPMMAATLVDRRWGDRLDPASRTARGVRAVGRGTVAVMRYAVFQPLLLIILTNLRGQKRGTLFFILLAVGALALAGREKLFPGRGFADGYTYLPDEPGRLGVEPGFYEDKRAEGEVMPDIPSIQSDMVRDPYVRLFIPYRPRRHNDLVAHRCAADGVANTPRPATEGGEAAVLRCLARLQPVTLNGRPVSAPFRFYTQPGTGIRGIAAYIPVAGLPKGENVLAVARLPVLAPEPGERPRPPFTIPFWL